jgi:hypothetical protein
VAREHRGPADVHRAQPVDDPAAHVLADGHGGRRRAEAGAQQDHAGDDVRDVVGAGLDRAAEQVDEDQHQQHRQQQRGQERVDLAHREPDAAPGHRDGDVRHRHRAP